MIWVSLMSVLISHLDLSRVCFHLASGFILFCSLYYSLCSTLLIAMFGNVRDVSKNNPFVLDYHDHLTVRFLRKRS